MAVLTTARLRLEPYQDSHLDGLDALNSDPQVMRYLGPVLSRDETERVIRRVQARWAGCGYSWWSFIERANGQIIGAGCIQNLRRSGTEPDLTCPVEIGWRLRRTAWHQGFASEAAVAMADFAFTTLPIETLCSVCHPQNVASEAVMKRLGMRYRGLETWYGMDLTCYELTRGEWERRA